MSPFNGSSCDYMRVCGPGFYVGCSYPSDEADLDKDNQYFHFALARMNYPVVEGVPLPPRGYDDEDFD
jgi:hypothetical protein